MKSVFRFFKKEAVLCISALLAIVSCFFVKPSMAYADYIDVRVLILLFCLMLVVAGIRKTNAFTALCEVMLQKLRSVRLVGLVMVLFCFLMSMLLTNDVTLVTVVPFTLLLFEKVQFSGKPRALMILLVLETAAANLGSMLTPMGNPQNLFFYSRFELSITSFLPIVLPYSVLSLLLVACSAFLFLPKLKMETAKEKTEIQSKGKLLFFSILFCVNMLTILRILDEKTLLLIVITAVLVIDRKLFLQVDYSLLFTFVFFFVFVGNFGSLSAVSDQLRQILQGREVIVSILLSQIISNVPAAILLSGLSENASALIIGTNLGGLGTLIASMASLITYKFYAVSKDSSSGRYLLIFTAFQLGYLAVLLLLHFILS